MAKDLISIIIPVYNVSNYLVQCLESVLNQTYTNLQVICIDDGSTDGSGDICDAYAKQDSRLQVIHQKNAGAGAARNAGLLAADGEYIGFVDSDDYVAEDMYRLLLDALINTGSDIAACNTVEVFQNHIEGKTDSAGELLCFSGMELMRKTAEHWKYYIMVNKLFRREQIQGIYFPEGNVIDDGFYTYQIIAKAKSVAWVEHSLYYYRQRKSSVMNLETYRECRMRDALRLQKVRVDFVREQYPEVSGAFQMKMLDTYIEIICSGQLGKTDERECLRYMRYNCSRALFREYSVKESLWIVLFLLFPYHMKRRRKRYTLELGRKTEDELFE